MIIKWFFIEQKIVIEYYDSIGASKLGRFYVAASA